MKLFLLLRIIAFSGILFFCGCSSAVGGEAAPPIPDVVVHSVSAEQQHTDQSSGSAQGLGIGFVWPEARHLPPEERPQTVELELAEGEVFDPFLILSAEQTTTVLLSVLLNYEQVPFELNEQKSLLHEVVVEPGGDLELPLKVEMEEPGIHDVIVLAFADPYNTSLDYDYRSSMRSKQLVGRRARVVVGGLEAPARRLPSPVQGTPVPPEVDLNLRIAFAQAADGDVHPSQRQLYVATTSPGEVFDFQIWASNLGVEQETSYAVVLLFNYHQLPLKDEDLVLVHLAPNEEAVIDERISLPSVPGVYQMQMVYVFDPYLSILEDEVQAPFVFASPRIAINTER